MSRSIYQRSMSAIKDIKEFQLKIQCCRELKIPRYGNLYTHHVFVGKTDITGCDLYHYSSVSSWLGSSGQITKVRLDYKEYDNISSPVRKIFNLKEKNGDEVYIVERRDYPKDKKAEDECIERAQQRLDEQNYYACCNNCESYVNWIFSGDNTSKQTENNLIKKVLGNMVDGASSRGAQHQLFQTPKAVIEGACIVGKECITVLGNTLEKMTHLIPTKTESINNLKRMAQQAPNSIKTALNSNIMQLNVGSKVHEELGKRMISSDVLDVIKQGPTQNVLLEQLPSLVEKQHARSLVRQVRIDGVERLQASSKSAAVGALKLNIASELVSLSIKIYQIKTDKNMTNDQQTRCYKKEIGSSVGGVLGTYVGGILMPPIIGGYIGGLLGNIIGGAIGGWF